MPLLQPRSGMARHHACMAVAVAALALLLAALPQAAAHGFMTLPASRNFIHSTYFNRTEAERQALPESYWDYW